MEKLELKHLAPYLPYRLKVRDEQGYEWEMGLVTGNHKLTIKLTINKNHPLKPILRPLSDLTEHAAKVWGIYSLKHLLGLIKGRDIPMHIYIELLEGHYDVFGLIPACLAIDKSTIK